jgi:hypothetical protein
MKKMPEKSGEPQLRIPLSRLKRVVRPEVRFEFQIPTAVPKEKVDFYMWEKLKRICKALSKNGLKVTPVIPAEYADREPAK